MTDETETDRECHIDVQRGTGRQDDPTQRENALYIDRDTDRETESDTETENAQQVDSIHCQ